MARFLCQLCYNVVVYGANHPCFYYKNDEEVYSLPELFCTGNRDENQDKSKDEFSKKSNGDSGDLTQSVQQNISKKSELINVPTLQHKRKDWFQSLKENMRTASAESSSDTQKTNPYKISYLNSISSVQMTDLQFKEGASFTASLEKVDSCYRPENDLCEANKIPPNVMDAKTKRNAFLTDSSENRESWNITQKFSYESVDFSTVFMDSLRVEEEMQRLSNISDLIHKTGSEGDEMSHKESKCESLNNKKMNLMISPECVITTDHSDNSNDREKINCEFSFPLKSNEHSIIYNKSEKTDTYITERISFERGNSSEAGPSGLCTRKKFNCTLCSMKCSSQYNLTNHYRTHTGERPFVCNDCKKTFIQKSQLNAHRNTHTGERPFVCPVCQKAFFRKGNLKEHIRTHKDEKPYKCSVCGISFTTSSSCNRHQKKMHEGNHKMA